MLKPEFISQNAWDFMLRTEAGDVGHTKRTLLHHLVGTAALLDRWGAGYDVIHAGFFHSIYGTNSFKPQMLTTTADREDLAATIGQNAELLAWEFCVIERPKTIISALENSANFVQARSGNAIRLPDGHLYGLSMIECANLIEQNTGKGFLTKFYNNAAIRTMFTASALQTIKEYCGITSQ